MWLFAPAIGIDEAPGDAGMKSTGLDKISVKDIFGVDSVQAIVLALQMIGFEVYNSDFRRIRTITF